MKFSFTHICLENWRNFRSVDLPLRERMFIVGPNASGKTNFLDAFKFLGDIAKIKGSLAGAVESRGGFGRIRSLHAHGRDHNLKILVRLLVGETQWEYELTLSGRRSWRAQTKSSSKGQRRSCPWGRSWRGGPGRPMSINWGLASRGPRDGVRGRTSSLRFSFGPRLPCSYHVLPNALPRHHPPVEQGAGGAAGVDPRGAALGSRARAAGRGDPGRRPAEAGKGDRGDDVDGRDRLRRVPRPSEVGGPDGAGHTPRREGPP